MKNEGIILKDIRIKETIFKKLKGILIKEFEIPENKIKKQTNLTNDLDLDSLDLIDLLVCIEKEFDIKFNYELRIKDDSILYDVIKLIIGKIKK